MLPPAAGSRVLLELRAAWTKQAAFHQGYHRGGRARCPHTTHLLRLLLQRHDGCPLPHQLVGQPALAAPCPICALCRTCVQQHLSEAGVGTWRWWWGVWGGGVGWGWRAGKVGMPITWVQTPAIGGGIGCQSGACLQYIITQLGVPPRNA